MFTIYCHTHIASGRRYVGQSVKGMVYRWKAHVTDATYGHTDFPFHRAIRKYGAAAFQHEVLETVSTVEESNAAERRWIAHFSCVVPNGFNLDAGGRAGLIHESTRRKMSAAQLARNAAMSPEERSEIAKKRARNETPEQRTARAIKINQAQTPEQRSERQRRASATMTPEARAVRAAKIWAGYTPAERSEIARKRTQAMSPEKRSDRVRKAQASKTPEQRSAVMVRTNANWTPEQRRSNALKANAALSPERRKERSRKIWETRRARYGQKGIGRRLKPEGTT